MRELLKVVRTDDDLVVVTTALLDLVALMPSVPSAVAAHLQEVFEVFSVLAKWRTTVDTSVVHEVQVAHVQVGLFALFHRYGQIKHLHSVSSVLRVISLSIYSDFSIFTSVFSVENTR